MEASFTPVGDAQIDDMRREASDVPTNAENYEERIVLVRGWRLFLQRIGVDLSDDVAVEEELMDAIDAEDPERIYAAVDAEIDLLESVQASVGQVS